MDSFSLFISVFVITWTCFLSYRFVLRQRRAKKLPPGPYPYPILGNMLQIGQKPHESFAELSKIHGPLMSIRLGSLYTIIVSSPEMSREILQTYGQIFSGRTIAEADRARDHDKISMIFLPAHKQWRNLRKICTEQMFSNHSLEASQELRQETLQQLLDYIQKCYDCGRAVDIREAAFTTTLNLMSATLLSTQATEFDSNVTQEFKEIVEGVATIVGVPNFADYFPILRPFDPQGVKRRADLLFGKLLGFIEGYLNERLETRKTSPDSPKKNDLLQTLVDIMCDGSEYKLTSDDITHLLLDLFAAGSETSATSIEFIMSELLLHPAKLSKVKNELKSVLGDKKHVQESDIPRLPYLQAVVKEVLRYHPPGPLFPRTAERDQEINGYLIPKGTQILFNVWAMGRDPNIWTNPDSFEPERFLHQKIDFKGQDFQLIPFGSGIRICPGMPLASRIVHMTAAVLVHNFDWKLEVGADDQGHVEKLFGLVLRRAVALRAIPVKL